MYECYIGKFMQMASILLLAQKETNEISNAAIDIL